MVRLVENERSWAIELISEINNYLSSVNLNIKKAGGETTINNSRSIDGSARKIMFPDVLLYSDNNKNNLLQGWEIKLPDISVHNQDYIDDAQYKAEKLGLNSTVLWNFKDVVLYVKKEDGWIIEHQWNDLNSIDSRENVRKKQNLWKEFLKSFLNELSSFYQDGTIEKRNLVEISNYLVTYLIEENKHILAEHLKTNARTNRLIEINIEKWWKKTKEEYLKDEEDKYNAYSKNILLNWIIRFTFGNIISNTHIEALEIKNAHSGNTPKEVNDIFERITETSDFYTIFSPQEYSELLPSIIWDRLTDFNSFLSDKSINHEIMQRMLENSISQYRREIVGQFTTPEKLALLLLHSTVVNIEGHDIDPCCGTGTIPKKIMELKIDKGMTELEVHDKTWASDKMSFPLQIANMSITTNTSMNLINKVFKRNVFELNNDIPITLTSPIDGQKIEYDLPKFTNVLSNLPFVPFETIEENEQQYISSLETEIRESSDEEIIFSRRSDFYFYIIAYLNSILEDNGRIGVITSNSWLGTESGKKLYQLLIHYYNLKTVIVSGNKKWFPNANVMSSIIVLEKKQIPLVKQDEKIQFVTLKSPLDDLSDAEIIEIGDDILSNNDNELSSVSLHSIEEIESYTSNYNISLNSLFYGVEWISNLDNKIVLLSTIFDVIRGMRRGWDELFYPEEGHGIEEIYIEKVLKSSRSIQGYDAETDTFAFCCSKTKDELEDLGHSGALNWINRFENSTNNVGRPLTEVLSRTNMKWYEMESSGSMAEIVTSLNPGSRLFWAKINEPSFINQRLIGITRNDNSQDLNITLLHALLNSVVGQFFIEATGFGRGLGALDLNADNIRSIYILDPRLLTVDQEAKIIKSFNELKDINIKDTIKELESPSKKKFDKLVLSAFGLEDNYELIKESLIRMISARLSVHN